MLTQSILSNPRGRRLYYLHLYSEEADHKNAESRPGSHTGHWQHVLWLQNPSSRHDTELSLDMDVNLNRYHLAQLHPPL